MDNGMRENTKHARYFQLNTNIRCRLSSGMDAIPCVAGWGWGRNHIVNHGKLHGGKTMRTIPMSILNVRNVLQGKDEVDPWFQVTVVRTKHDRVLAVSAHVSSCFAGCGHELDVRTAACDWGVVGDIVLDLRRMQKKRTTELPFRATVCCIALSQKKTENLWLVCHGRTTKGGASANEGRGAASFAEIAKWLESPNFGVRTRLSPSTSVVTASSYFVAPSDDATHLRVRGGEVQ